jgi:protein TonB
VGPAPQVAAKTPATPAAPYVGAVAPSTTLPPKPSDDKAKQRYAQEISRKIARNITTRDYPLLARERGWQGTAQLLLRIHADGKLNDVTVASSSGYDVLDDRAVELVKRMQLPALPDEITSAFSVRVPVRFSLPH